MKSLHAQFLYILFYKNISKTGIFSSNYFSRNSPAQSSSTSSRTKRKVWDWSKSWKKYKKQQTTINEEQTETEIEEEGECRCKRCITRAMNNPEKALNSVSQIDKISRIVFPMAFISLNGFYWFTYLKHSQRIDLSFESA